MRCKIYWPDLSEYKHKTVGDCCIYVVNRAGFKKAALATFLLSVSLEFTAIDFMGLPKQKRGLTSISSLLNGIQPDSGIPVIKIHCAACGDQFLEWMDRNIRDAHFSPRKYRSAVREQVFETICSVIWGKHAHHDHISPNSKRPGRAL